MKNAVTYFNKVLNLNPQSRSEKDVCLHKHTKGLLLEMEDSLRYQYFLPEVSAISKNIAIPFSVLYGLKGFQGYTVDDSSLVLNAETDLAVPYSWLENKEESFAPVAKMDIEVFADTLYGCSAFAKKGKHLYNQKTFVMFTPQNVSLYSGTDITIMRNVCEANVANMSRVFGIDNVMIPKIKKWINYVNNPKNGTGDTLWILLNQGFMKLQAQNCSVIFPVSSLPTYLDIVKKFASLLDYPYDLEECEVDWDELQAAIKTKEEFISIGEEEVLRTYSSDFVSYASLKEYETYRLKTNNKALFLKQDNSTILFMLKEKEDTT